MSIVLYNLGYEYEEMLKLTAEEIDFIFPNTELLANLVARGYREQEVQTEAVRKAGKTYKEIIREAMKKPEAEIDWQALAAGYNPPKIDGLLQAIRDSEITGDGSVAITPVIKREFNRMGEDYRFSLCLRSIGTILSLSRMRVPVKLFIISFLPGQDSLGHSRKSPQI
jgi:hypothetical protein